MLETLRTYARDRIDELGESDQWRRRHAEHYADLAEIVGPQLISRDEFAARRRFRVELDNTRAAVTWALDADDPSAQELGVRIVLAFGYEVTTDRRAGTGLWAEHALRRVETWQPARRVGVLSIAAMSGVSCADFPTASAWVDEGFEIGVSVDTPVALMLWISAFERPARRRPVRQGVGVHGERHRVLRRRRLRLPALERPRGIRGLPCGVR